MQKNLEQKLWLFEPYFVFVQVAVGTLRTGRSSNNIYQYQEQEIKLIISMPWPMEDMSTS